MTQQDMKVEATGSVTFGPGTTQFIITCGPESDQADVEVMRSALIAARVAAHREMTHPSLWEVRAYQ